MLTASIYDIAVLTSKLEGFANSIVEYFAVGKPVVATDVGGVNEIITDGKNGFLVTFGDINQLQNKIIELIENPEIRKKFSLNAVKMINNKFNNQNMINKLEQFFKKQIG